MNQTDGEVEPSDPRVVDGRPRIKSSRISPRSVVFSHFLPALILGMGVLTLVLILIAAGVLLGFIPFR